MARNVAEVRRRIAAAGGSDVELIAVTKTFGVDAIVAAVNAGCTAIGENYAQELVAKLDLLPTDVARPEVHFIGHLQSNKVRMLARYVDVWQTADRDSVIDELAHRVAGARVFIQVNVDDDPHKGGCTPDAAPGLVRRARLAGLVVEGLMTIGRQGPPEQVSVGFRTLRAMADGLGLVGCSMGMSGDLEQAVAAGATHVRVGSALFGERVRQPGDSLG